MWPRGDPKRRRKQVTKTKTSNGRPKRENKRPKPQSDRAGAIQTLFATLHTKSKYHGKCLDFGSHFQVLLVPFSCIFPQSGQRAPGPRPKVLKVAKMEPKCAPIGGQGCPHGPPRSPKVLKKRQSVPQACPTGGPRCRNGVPRSPRCHKNATRVHKLPL